jgi:hypothetical protein
VNCRAGGPGRPLTGPASEAELPVDHLVYGASDLEAAVVDLEWRLGVRAAVGGQHQNLGTHNALLGEGCHLEVIAPDPTLPAPLSGRPFSLDSLERDRLVGWALRTRDRGVHPEALRTTSYDLRLYRSGRPERILIIINRHRRRDDPERWIR